jgi:sphingolipid delta-4 desaturase
MMTQPGLAGPFFAFDDSVEKHSARRNAILKAHPEVRELYGSYPIIFLDSFSRVLLMIFLSWTVSDLSWPWLIFVSWIVAGTINHTLALALHELSHGLAFGKPLYDNLAMLAVNTVMGLPTAMSFKYYHPLHHDALGRYSEDTDLASLWETRVFHNSRLLKFVRICCQPLFYALRPFILAPHPPTNWEIANWVSCLTFDAAVY